MLTVVKTFKHESAHPDKSRNAVPEVACMYSVMVLMFAQMAPSTPSTLVSMMNTSKIAALIRFAPFVA